MWLKSSNWNGTSAPTAFDQYFQADQAAVISIWNLSSEWYVVAEAHFGTASIMNAIGQSYSTQAAAEAAMDALIEQLNASGGGSAGSSFTFTVPETVVTGESTTS